MTLHLSPLQHQWLQEMHVPSVFLKNHVPLSPLVAKPIKPTKLTKPTVQPAKALVPTPAPTPVFVPVDVSGLDLQQLHTYVAQCEGCELHESRSQTVVGAGQVRQPEFMVISTAPSSYEELEGRPMQGKSGELFAAQMHSIGIEPEQQLYLTQLLKCRTDNPTTSHIQACQAILFKQIELIQPQRLLLLGSKAAALFLGTALSFEQLRGQIHHWQSLPVVVSKQPTSLLLRPQEKAQAWRDLQLMRQLLQRSS